LERASAAPPTPQFLREMMENGNMQVEIEFDIVETIQNFTNEGARIVPISSEYDAPERVNAPSGISPIDWLTGVAKEVHFPVERECTAGHARANSDLGVSSPRSLHFRDFSSARSPTVEDGDPYDAQSQQATEDVSASTTPALVPSLEEKIQQWNISDATRESQLSTIPAIEPTLADAILRHQHRQSDDTIKGGIGPKPYCTDEICYLRAVIDFLYEFLVEQAFSDDEIRYSQTFRWRFKVYPKVTP
jgi:hypothetical protein